MKHGTQALYSISRSDFSRLELWRPSNTPSRRKELLIVRTLLRRPMKPIKTNPLTRWPPMIGLIFLSFSAANLSAQTSAFTFQGRLEDTGTVPSGTYDIRFTIYDSSTGGSIVAGPLTNAATVVSNGLFAVTLDFGADAFSGADRWLDLGVRTNGSVSGYTVLSPRQALAATPYAVRAANFGGAVSDSQLPANIARLNASQTFTGANTFNNAGNSFSGSG